MFVLCLFQRVCCELVHRVLDRIFRGSDDHGDGAVYDDEHSVKVLKKLRESAMHIAFVLHVLTFLSDYYCSSRENSPHDDDDGDEDDHDHDDEDEDENGNDHGDGTGSDCASEDSIEWTGESSFSGSVIEVLELACSEKREWEMVVPTMDKHHSDRDHVQQTMTVTTRQWTAKELAFVSAVRVLERWLCVDAELSTLLSGAAKQFQLPLFPQDSTESLSSALLNYSL